MADHCQTPNVIEKILSASHAGVAYLGGSLTVGVGASNVAETSWRGLFTKYLYGEFNPKYHCQVSEIMGAVGASESYVTSFTLGRNVLPSNPDLAFIEFCVNDWGAPSDDLVVKGMEGMVRQLLAAKNSCDVIIVGCGSRDGKCDHSRHRKVAEHYDLPFVDLQTFLFDHLAKNSQVWDDIAIEYEVNDPWHMNDYGNRLCFDAIRSCFEEQLRLFQAGKRKPRRRQETIPAPLVSDELQFVELVDPAVASRRAAGGVTLEGEWERKSEGRIPWYFDNLLVGKPGAKLKFVFKGTAVAAYGLMYHNGLKLEAVLDGKEVPGAYFHHFIEFGKGLVLGHGLTDGEHVLELTVGQPLKRQNKLENPTAQLAYLGVARKPDKE